MNHKKYWLFAFLIAAGIAISCSVDESKFPLPYNSRTLGAYTRVYQQTSTTFEFTDPNAAYVAVFEPVDSKNGDDTDSIVFYVSHRRGVGLSREVFVKSVPIDASFTKPAAPTYSVYKRGTVRITLAEALAALAPFAGIDPDGPATATDNFLSAYPGGAIALADQFVFRWVQVLKDKRRFTVFNPQQNVNPKFGNAKEENGTPNITTGQFYSAPFTATMTVRDMNTGVAPVPYVGTYRLVMRTIWSPAHTNVAGRSMHALAFPKYMNTLDFPDQDVTVAQPASPALASERELTVRYRGADVKLKVNLEPTSNGASTTSLNNLMNAGPPNPISGVPVGYGLQAGATTANTGTVFVQLQNSTVSCSSSRQFYWVTPASGTFAGTAAIYNRFDVDGALAPLGTVLPGLPAFTVPNRGVYRRDIDGLTPGNWFTIGIDDDSDEYGRRNGYCSWTRRVLLTLVKL